MKTSTIIGIWTLVIAGVFFAKIANTPLIFVEKGEDGKYIAKESGLTAPTSESKLVLESGTADRKAKSGDIVSLHYEMFRWGGKEVVEDSSKMSDVPLRVEAGFDFEKAASEGRMPATPYRVPKFITDSVIGAANGEVIQVVLPGTTPDLAEHLSRDESYILVVKVLGIEDAPEQIVVAGLEYE